MKIPLPLVVELNRRLLKGYTQLKDEPQVVELAESVLAYNAQLKALGIKDHQVQWGNLRGRSRCSVTFTLLRRICELSVLSLGALPSVALFWPVFVTTRVISHRKQREALADSVVKLEGKDVVSSWKLIVAMVFAPALYTWYTLVVTLWLSYNRSGGLLSTKVPWWLNATTYIPAALPLPTFSILFFILMIAVSFAGLRIGEVGVDILKSLPPLFVALNPSSSPALVSLRAQRHAVVAQVVETINTFGPEIFPSFDSEKLVEHPDTNNYSSSSGMNAYDDVDDDAVAVNVDYATYRSRLKRVPSSGPETALCSRSPAGHASSMSLLGDEMLEHVPIDLLHGEADDGNRRIDGWRLRQRARDGAVTASGAAEQ